MMNSHMTAAIAQERERALRRAAAATRARTEPAADAARPPARRRLISRVTGREDRRGAAEPARSAR